MRFTWSFSKGPFSIGPFAGALMAGFAAIAPAHGDRFTLEYTARAWSLAPLGSARLDVMVDDTDYYAETTLKSGGVLALFEQTALSADAEGALSPEGVQWRRYDLDHSYSKKRRVTALRRTEAGVESRIIPIYSAWGDPPASEEMKRESFDPLSAMVAMGLRVAQTRLCDAAFPTFDGKYRYDLVLLGGRIEPYEAGGYSGPVLKCRIQYRRVAGYEPTDPNQVKKIPEGELWFALAEGSRFAPPVRAILPLPLGHAGISLKSWKRATVTVGAQTRAD